MKGRSRQALEGGGHPPDHSRPRAAAHRTRAEDRMVVNGVSEAAHAGIRNVVPWQLGNVVRRRSLGDEPGVMMMEGQSG
jgi:hypothetical protein